MGRRRHTMAVEELVPPDAARVATVYTNAPKRPREAVFADLCTLLRPHGPLRDRVGHESHGIDGPLAPVTPGCLDLRPTPPGR